MHYSSVSRITRRVGTAIARRAGEFIKMPNTQEERDKQNLLFYEKARFPRVIGVIDCTHIRLQSPGKYLLIKKIALVLLKKRDIKNFVEFCLINFVPF